jgi:hypothetical protein
MCSGGDFILAKTMRNNSSFKFFPDQQGYGTIYVVSKTNALAQTIETTGILQNAFERKRNKISYIFRNPPNQRNEKEED